MKKRFFEKGKSFKGRFERTEEVRRTERGSSWNLMRGNSVDVWISFGIFNIRVDDDWTPGPYGHRTIVCTESFFWEKNLLPHLGFEPASILIAPGFSVGRSIPTELSQH